MPEVRSLLCPLALILADSQMLTWIPVVGPMVSRAVVDWPPLIPVLYGNLSGNSKSIRLSLTSEGHSLLER